MGNVVKRNFSVLRKALYRKLRPVAFLLFGAIVVSFSIFKNNPLARVTTIVIDAGHGGKDPGCSGVSSKEKDVTLAVALKLGKLIEERLKDVKVIFTRKSDVFVELEERAQIANRNNADLFISIHCNAASYMETVIVNGKKRKKEVINTKPYGSETYVMGIKNENGKANVMKRENSAMLLEDGYKEKYGGFDPNSDESYIIMSQYTDAFVEQSGKFASNIQKEYKNKVGRIDKGVRRESLWVLWRTKMPSVLTEIGYLTNPEEEKFISSEKGQYALAAGLFRAFRNYKTDIEGSGVKYNDEIENMEAIQNENVLKGDTAYLHEVEDYQDDSDTLDQNPQEKLKQLYQDANKFFSIGDYNNAETKYNEIKGIKEDDKTAKDKLAEIKKIRTNYKVLIDKADKNFKEKKYTEAKKQYGDAQILMPKEKYPTERIKECELALKGKPVDADSEFSAWMAKGNSLMAAKKYGEAKQAYENALKIKTDSEEAKKKIDECGKAMLPPDKTIEKYAILILDADHLLKDKKYREAKNKYFEASLVKPDDDYPKLKIEEITKILDNEAAEKEKQYSSEMSKALDLFNKKEYKAAKESYSAASKIKPEEQQPRDQIKICDSEIEKERIAAMGKHAAYESTIKKANEAFTAKKWSDAVFQFNEASKIQALDENSSGKLKMCEVKVAAEAADKKQYEEAMKYGSDYLMAKEFIKAKEAYGKALSFKPADAEAKEKIFECDQYINADKEKIYKDEIAAGDAFFLKKDFNGAIDHYKKAELVKPAEDYPKFQVKLCEKSIVWQKQSEEFKVMVDAGDNAKAGEKFDAAADKYREAVNYIASAKENKSKFKPNTEELNKRIAEVLKLKEEKSKPAVIVKKDSSVNKTNPDVPAGDIIIKVQFTQSEKELDVKSAKFRGMENISYYTMSGMLKYTSGAFTNVDDAIVYRDKVKQMGFKDAFLVAFNKGQRIDIKTAVELLSQKKNP